MAAKMIYDPTDPTPNCLREGGSPEAKTNVAYNVASERALDDYCLKVMQRQNNDSVTLNTFISDTTKVAVMDAIGLYNGEEI